MPSSAPGGGTLVFEYANAMPAELYILEEESYYNRIKNPGQKSNPAGIPPSEWLPTDPAAANAPSAIPFNPNQFPSSGNLTPNPTGSGEPEFNIPDIDHSPDPDFDPGLDPDFGIDPESDKPTDPETPPDTPPDDDPPEDD